ncbi:MAG TPA: site-specific integrase [Gaiellales bacterium]|jgi:integrase
MPSLTITTRQTASGPRYVVRYRLGGRAYRVEHGGSFRTLREAKARRDLVGGEIAAGRNPRLLLDAMREPVVVRTLAGWAEEFIASRNGDGEAAKMPSHMKRILPAFGALDPSRVTFHEVQRWVNEMDAAPSSVRRYLCTLRLLLDYAGVVADNPARDRRLRLPKLEQDIPNPPSRAEVDLILAAASDRHRLLFRLLAETGMRVGEACDLEWQDVDFAGCRLRVRRGKTAAAKRWVPLNDSLMMDLQAWTPPDDRTPERRVFQGLTRKAVGSAMRRACQAAGTAHYHPHDLRHRWISLQVKRGVPITEIAAHVGHSRSSITLDTYAHVLLGEGDA